MPDAGRKNKLVAMQKFRHLPILDHVNPAYGISHPAASCGQVHVVFCCGIVAKLR